MVFIDLEENTRILIKIVDKDNIADKINTTYNVAESVSDKFIRCPKCSYDNLKDWQNCGKCGAPLQ